MGPGTLAVVDPAWTTAWLWTSAEPNEGDEVVWIGQGSCAVVLSSPVGDEERKRAVMVLCDGRIGWAFLNNLELVDDGHGACGNSV